VLAHYHQVRSRGSWHPRCTRRFPWTPTNGPSSFAGNGGFSSASHHLGLLCLLLLPFGLTGCLSNSYYVPRDELARLSALPPEERWQSVRAIQEINGDDYPPNDEVLLERG
jgi:hypothetical protein